MSKQLRLGAFLPGAGQHIAAWRHPGSNALALLNFFLADGLRVNFSGVIGSRFKSPPIRSLSRILVSVLLVFSGLAAQAQTPFPNKPLTIVVPSAPGGSPDILARTIAPALSARLNQPVNVENKAGGAGNIAAQAVASATSDGYTLFLANDQLSVNQTLFPRLPFHAVKSFAPVLQLNSPCFIRSTLVAVISRPTHLPSTSTGCTSGLALKVPAATADARRFVEVSLHKASHLM